MTGRMVAGLIRGAFEGAEGFDEIDPGSGIAVRELCGPDGFVEDEGEEDVSGRGRGDQVAAGQFGAGAVEEAIRHSGSLPWQGAIQPDSGTASASICVLVFSMEPAASCSLSSTCRA